MPLDPRVYAVDITETRIDIPTTPLAAGSPVWVAARPNLRRLHVLAGDILATLGKRHDVAGKGRNQNEDLSYAAAWLRAHDTPDMVIVDAQHLHPKILSGLAKLATTAQVSLWMLHRPPANDNFHRALARRQPRTAHLADVPAPRARADTADGSGVVLPSVPTAPFHVFLHACTTRLSGDDLTAVQGRFDDVLRSCDKHFEDHGATADTVAALLHTILNPAPDDNTLIVDLRALQVAGWHHDLFIKANLTTVLNSEERPRISATDADQRLTAYRQPYRAIVCALTRQDVALADIANIRIADANSDTIVAGRHTITPGAATARAIRAAVYLRENEGATPDDLLLPFTEPTLARVLQDAAHDLGIHLHGRRAERRNHTTSRLRQFGITIAALP